LEALPRAGREPFSVWGDQLGTDTREDAMMEFADIFAYDLNTVIVAGPVVALALFSLAVAWLNHVPSRVRAFDLAPAFGL
jgi:hypothetical protein